MFPVYRNLLNLIFRIAMKKSLILFIFLCGAACSFSQEKMNTKKWRKTEQDSMGKAQVFFDEGNKDIALPIFERLLNAHPNELYLKYITAVCGLQRSDWHRRSLQLLQEVYAKNKKVHNIEWDIARALHYNYKFDEATAMLDQFELKNKKIEPEVKTQIPLLRNYCANGKKMLAEPKTAKITNIGPPVNTGNSEYVPVLNADESVMIFTYRGEQSTGGIQNAYNEPSDYGIYYEDVFISHKKNGAWAEPAGITPVNTRENDAAICLSHDGQTLFLFRDDRTNGGDILVSRLTGTEWSTPDKLYGDINTPSWEGSISLSPDEKMVIFSSERPGGYGGKDLYMSYLQADGNWGEAQNLGDKINTPYDDDAPFIHPDGRTMIFSSKGYNSMGGFDIFRTSREYDSLWTTPVNLGYPINTTDDDIYYVLSTDGKRGYYASGKEGGSGLQDIYLVEPGVEGYSPDVMVLKGTVTLKQKAVAGEIEIVSVATGSKFKLMSSNSEDGKYLVVLPGGADYSIRYKLAGHEDQLRSLAVPKATGYTEKIIDIDFAKKDSVPLAVNTPTVAATPTTSIVPTATTTTIPDVTNTMTKEGLIFKVQIAAYKLPDNYTYRHLSGMGQVEKMTLEDQITRFTIGGEFKSLDDANMHCKKVRSAGQQDAFVTAIYNGKRVYLEELEAKGIIPKRN
jgi:hypothetical protein